MRITSLLAHNFLSLSDLRLTLDPAFNVFVGPNGAGKTNAVHALRLAREALQRGDQLAEWRRARTLGGEEPGFEVGFGLELESNWDRQALTSFVGAALTCSRLSEVLSRNPGISADALEVYGKWLEEQLTPSALESLFTGTLQIKWHGDPEDRWEIGYEFKHNGQRYRWLLVGPHEDSIVVANTPGTALTETRAYEIMAQPYLADVKRLHSKQFDLQMILPRQHGQGVGFSVEPLRGLPPSKFLRDFVELPGVTLLGDRFYPAWSMFSLLIRRNLLFMHDSRVIGKREFSDEDLGRSIDGMDLSTGADTPLYLFRMSTGAWEEREAYERICDTFQGFTGLKLAVRYARVQQTQEDQPSQATTVELVIARKDGDIPIRFSGAGVWEALILSTFISVPQGRVLVLDEPAVNLHPTLQRKVLRRLRTLSAQSFIITHSPYLVPIAREQDLACICRFHLIDGTTRVASLRESPPNDSTTIQRLMKELSRTVDVPGLLFAQAVLLVEGETESGALPVWFEQNSGGLDNLVVQAVNGDRNFGTYIKFLTAFKIPWAVLCDGPAIAEGRIFEQIGVQTPSSEPISFVDKCKYGEAYGVFTLASQASDEFETLSFIAPQLLRAREAVGPSKARLGRFLSQELACPDEVASLHLRIVLYLRELQSQQ